MENNSLLVDSAFLTRIKDELLLNIETYASNPYSPDVVLQFQINNLEFRIDICHLSSWRNLEYTKRGTCLKLGLINCYPGRTKKKIQVAQFNHSGN